MAGGISPNRKVTIELGDYNPDHYLTILYQAMLNRGWHIGYFDHDGIIAYTNISWESYSEEVSARIIDGKVVIKSECVGCQLLFYDYGKNKKNLDRLLDEVAYADFHLQHHLEETTQELMNAIPEKQFLNLEDPPMAGKETLRGFFSPFVPKKKYLITPLLMFVNIGIFLITSTVQRLLPEILERRNGYVDDTGTKILMFLGYNDRTHVLNGQVWRLLTSVFLHFSILHLAMNMIVLVYIGSLVESKLGKWNYLMMFLFTGVISSTASVAFHTTEISGGASGAIFGLFGILLALLSTGFYERSARRALLISTAIFVTWNIIPLGEGVDHAAHFGGLISGYVLGWIAYLGMTHRSRFVQKWGIALAGSLIVVSSVVGAVLFLPQYQVKELNQIEGKSTALAYHISRYFYGQVELERPAKLDTIQQTVLPALKRLKGYAAKLKALKLPSKKKKEADTEAVLITLQCEEFRLLCLEFQENNTDKYRPEINAVVDKINDIRANWYSNN